MQVWICCTWAAFIMGVTGQGASDDTSGLVSNAGKAPTLVWKGNSIRKEQVNGENQLDNVAKNLNFLRDVYRNNLSQARLKNIFDHDFKRAPFGAWGGKRSSAPERPVGEENDPIGSTEFISTEDTNQDEYCCFPTKEINMNDKMLEEPEERVDDKRSSFASWGGKRSSFVPWGGKRSSFVPWGGKRSSFVPWGGKRSSFAPWGGKRSSFAPWGGKRSSFVPWGGKRSSFVPWGGKRSSFVPWGGKRSSFVPWGGKRTTKDETLLEKNVNTSWPANIAFGQVGNQYSRPSDRQLRSSGFRPWAGKRMQDDTDTPDELNQQNDEEDQLMEEIEGQRNSDLVGMR